MTPVNPITPQIDISSEFRKALRFFGLDKIDKGVLEVTKNSPSYNPFISQMSGSKSLLIFMLLADMGDSYSDRHNNGCGYCSPLEPTW
jgi:hypothetical protein